MSNVRVFNEVLGETLLGVSCAFPGAFEFKFSGGEVYEIWSYRDLIEWRRSVEVVGNLTDLVGVLLEAEVVTGQTEESNWSYCKFRTAAGFVVFRWTHDGPAWSGDDVVFQRIPDSTMTMTDQPY